MRRRTTRNRRRVLSKVDAGQSAAPSSPVGPAAKDTVVPPPRIRTVVVPKSPKRAMAAQRALQKAQAEAKQKKINKAKQAMQGAVVNGKRQVSLSPAAMKRLSRNAAFQVSPMAAPRQEDSVAASTQRAGFVMPPASPRPIWRDESEDGSMWDR